MDATELLGWGASAILVATLARQVWAQWQERRTEGVSSWLFIGQIVASAAFAVYSVLVDNPVFVFTDSVLLLTAITGQCLYLRNRRLEKKGDA